MNEELLNELYTIAFELKGMSPSFDVFVGNGNDFFVDLPNGIIRISHTLDRPHALQSVDMICELLREKDYVVSNRENQLTSIVWEYIISFRR